MYAFVCRSIFVCRDFVRLAVPILSREIMEFSLADIWLINAEKVGLRRVLLMRYRGNEAC